MPRPTCHFSPLLRIAKQLQTGYFTLSRILQQPFICQQTGNFVWISKMEAIFQIPFKVLAVPNVKIRKPGWLVIIAVSYSSVLNEDSLSHVCK